MTQWASVYHNLNPNEAVTNDLTNRHARKVYVNKWISYRKLHVVQKQGT